MLLLTDGLNIKILVFCVCQHYGLPTKIITVIQKLYKKNSSEVRVNGDTSS